MEKQGTVLRVNSFSPTASVLIMNDGLLSILARLVLGLDKDVTVLDLLVSYLAYFNDSIDS